MARCLSPATRTLITSTARTRGLGMERDEVFSCRAWLQPAFRLVPAAVDLLLAFGLLMSTASQLRPAGAKIGPGEACLVIWLLVMLSREVNRLGPPLTPALWRLVVFWTLFVFAQSMGTFSGYVIGDRHDPGLFLHDVMAYSLLAAVSLLSVVEPGAALRLQRVARQVALLGGVFLVLQLAHAWELISIATIDPWYWDRLRGWSENPNQLAILCAILGPLSLHVAEAATRFSERAAAIACALLAFLVGRLTKSDTFSLLLVAAGPIYVALKLRTWLAEAKPTFRSAAAGILALGLPLLVASTIPLGYTIAVEAEDFARQMSKDNGEGTEREAQLRLHSWREAISRGLESGMLGLGPGPHLEIPPVLVAARKSENEPKNLEHPEVNSMPNFEAHNTYLDLFTQGGFIAVLSFVWLAATAFWTTYKAKLDALTTLLCGLALFTALHLIVRHPLFWFATALSLVLGDEARRASSVRNWS
jgi:O-antigen ligase